MKRFFVLALALCLLTGCAGKKGDTAPATSTEKNKGWYLSGSDTESLTGQAVRTYQPAQSDILWLSMMGDKLLVATPDRLTVLTGAEGVPTASVQLGIDLDPGAGGYQTTHNGFAYFDAKTREAVYLDQQLQEFTRIKMPEEIQGSPAFVPDGSEIFYCVENEIRAYDTDLNITRPMKSHACKAQALKGVYFDGDVLLCEAEYEDGTVSTMYLSTATGETLSTDEGVEHLYTSGSSFLALRMDGIVPQRITGTLESGARNDLAIGRADAVGGAVELNLLVGCVAGDEGLTLSAYDLTTGTKTAAVTLENIQVPTLFAADKWSGSLWFAAENADGKQLLYRWEVKKSPAEEAAACLAPVYTPAAPDTAGLDACRQRANAMDSAYGVDVRIWQEASRTTGGYEVKGEHQPQAIASVLDRLEPALARYPDKFLAKSSGRRIRICIVRSISGEQTAVQFRSGRDVYILLTPGCDVAVEFDKAMGYVVDSHVLGNSPMFDQWSSLNPEGFAYGTADKSLLSGEGRAFFDEQSMSSATEDRARIFWQAMTADNSALFQSPAMQAKLNLMCRAIRDSWRLEKKTETYPWEQYLQTPIAYQG